MKFDRTSIITIAGFLIFVFAYDRFLKNKYPQLNQPPTSQSSFQPPPDPLDAPPVLEGVPSASISPPPATASSLAPSSPRPPAPPPLEQRIFENTDVLWEIDPTGGGFNRVELKGFQAHTPDQSTKTDEINQGARVNMVSDRLWIQPLLSTETLDDKPYEVTVSPTTATFSRTTNKLKITHTYQFPDAGYHVNWSTTIDNIGSSTQPAVVYLTMADLMHPLPAKSSLILPGMPLNRPSMVAVTDSSQERFDTEKVCKKTTETLLSSATGILEVLGFDRYHFITALIGTPVNPPSRHSGGIRGTYRLSKRLVPPGGHCQFLILAGQNFGSITAGEQVRSEVSLFFGPKDYRITKAIHPKLKATIDLGWFAFLAHPLLYVLHFFYDLTNNYGVAIILLTLVLKILFFPLTRAAALSMNKTRIYQPELNAIRARYKGDMAKQQRETMAFMAKHKINPMKGCLPILPQMPVFIALYRVLSTAVELRQAPFAGWLQDLSAPDPFIITPMLLAACMFFQQKLMPQMGGDELQRKIMMWMPVIFALMMIGFPSGMVLYMLVNTLVSMAQQQYFNAMFKKNRGASA